MFSLNWFTTIPGLLITGGVLLLVIALIIFIVTSRKEKKNVSANSNNANNINAGGLSNLNETVNQPTAVQPVFNQQPTDGSFSLGQNASMVENTPVIAPTVMDNPVSDNFSNPGINAPMENFSVEQSLNVPSSVENVAVMPTVDSLPVNNQEVVNESMGIPTAVAEVNSASTISPSISELQTPVMDSFGAVDSSSQEVVVPAISEVQENSSSINVNETVAPSVEQVVPELQDVGAPSIGMDGHYTSPYNQSAPNNTSIYGGASPNVSGVVVNQISPQIYGGANPLEGTQAIPVASSNNEINSQQSVPPLEVTPVVNISAPVVEQPAVTPVSNVSIPDSNNVDHSVPVVEPTVSTYTVQQPVISNDPVINPINNNFTYQSATAPQVQIPTDGNIQ